MSLVLHSILHSGEYQGHSILQSGEYQGYSIL